MPERKEKLHAQNMRTLRKSRAHYIVVIEELQLYDLQYLNKAN